MNCITKTAACMLAALTLYHSGIRHADAVQLTLNLVPADSSITLTGTFGGIPLSAQEGIAGVTDLDPARPSNQTTFGGTITVDVNNVTAPSSIRILSSAASANTSGTWLPEVQPFQDLNGNGEFGEFGLPPDGDSSTAASNDAAPATNADWGVKVRHPAFGVDVAFGGLRDIVYNVTSTSEAVNPAGDFSSLSENFEFATGWLDYWVAQAAGNQRGRAEYAGGDDNNMSATPSKFTVTQLGGGRREYRLMIPISINDMGSDLVSIYNGQFLATLIVPEPSSLFLLGLGGLLAFVRIRRGK